MFTIVKKVLSPVVILVIFLILFWNIYLNWEQLTSYKWNFSFKTIIIVLSFSISLYFANVFAWHIISKSLNFKISFKENLKIWMVSNLSRYLPGGIWQYPTRVIMVSKKGPSKLAATSAVIFESLFGMAVGGILSLFLIKTLPIANNQSIQFLLQMIALSPLLLFLFSSARFTSYLSKSLKKVTKKNLKIENIDWKKIPGISGAFFLQYFFAGVTLYVLANTVTELNLTHLPLFIAIYAASWLLGYISFFAPAGLGVQDVSIAGLLSLLMPAPSAIIVTIAFRLVLIIGEMLTLGSVFWVSRQTNFK